MRVVYKFGNGNWLIMSVKSVDLNFLKYANIIIYYEFLRACMHG